MTRRVALPEDERRICVVTDYFPAPSETFIRDHIENLPARVVLIHGWRPTIGQRSVLSFPERLAHKALRMVTGAGLQREATTAYIKAFRNYSPQAALAEYGPTAVRAMDACKRLGVPLIAHFHGYDASVHDVLNEHSKTYPILFAEAAAVVAVSRAMQNTLISLGAPERKVHYNPCGVDCSLFGGASPAGVGPVFLSVGRFIEKKAPSLTLSAFAAVHRVMPDARLRMIGEGPLLRQCRELAGKLGINEAVTFLGTQPPRTVQDEMRKVRCLVQHSVRASNGDCEGTPVAVLEAGASGLPVVATHHGGIPDVIVEGKTGFLVAERDIEEMARAMLRLAADPLLAANMGLWARSHIETNFSQARSLDRLWKIIEGCIR